LTGYDLQLLAAWSGYALAIWLYFGLGKIFWVPIALDLVYDMLGVKFDLWGNNVETLVIETAYVVLLLLWVIYLSGFMKSKWSTWIAFALIMVASFTGIVSTAIYQNIGMERFAEFLGFPGYHRKWILLATLSMYTWFICTSLVIFGVILRSTVFRWINGKAANLISNPRNRVLIPIFFHTSIIGFSQFYSGFVPDDIYAWRFKIAGTLLGWGWVALELPFYIMYRRMLRIQN
jgi:hypothetical protein